jgi:hypothetical protein
MPCGASSSSFVFTNVLLRVTGLNLLVLCCPGVHLIPVSTITQKDVQVTIIAKEKLEAEWAGLVVSGSKLGCRAMVCNKNTY